MTTGTVSVINGGSTVSGADGLGIPGRGVASSTTILWPEFSASKYVVFNEALSRLVFHQVTSKGVPNLACTMHCAVVARKCLDCASG